MFTRLIQLNFLSDDLSGKYSGVQSGVLQQRFGLHESHSTNRLFAFCHSTDWSGVSACLTIAFYEALK